MPARPRSARAGTEGNSCPAGDTMGVRGLCPRTFTREAGVPNPERKRSFRSASGFAPAAEDQAAEGEAEAEGADCEAADREGLSPGRESLPAAEGLALFTREGLASALLPDRAARPETEIEVVEDLGRLFGHADQTIASTGRAHTRFTPL